MVVGAIGAIVSPSSSTRGHPSGHSYHTFVIMLSLVAAFLGVAYAPWMASFTETVESGIRRWPRRPGRVGPGHPHRHRDVGVHRAAHREHGDHVGGEGRRRPDRRWTTRRLTARAARDRPRRSPPIRRSSPRCRRSPRSTRRNWPPRRRSIRRPQARPRQESGRSAGRQAQGGRRDRRQAARDAAAGRGAAQGARRGARGRPRGAQEVRAAAAGPAGAIGSASSWPRTARRCRRRRPSRRSSGSTTSGSPSAGEIVFIPLIFLMAGYWSAARARRAEEEHERWVEAELAKL